jgi:hypothetical protein
MSDRSKSRDPYEYRTVDSAGRRRQLEADGWEFLAEVRAADGRVCWSYRRIRRSAPIVPWPGAWLETKANSGGASMEA